MIEVSDRFIQEQLKTRSGGERMSILAYAGWEAKDLTPFFIRDSLSRIEWRLEDEMTAYLPSDAQISLWYDEVIWSWLNANEPIRVEIFSGFEFEKIRKFWGYVDKDNLRKDSTGVIYMRVYSFIDYLKTIKTSEIFGAPLPTASYVSLSKTIKQILGYLNIPYSRWQLKVLPLDTYPDATTYVGSFHDTDLPVPDMWRSQVCRIDDRHFYYLDMNRLWMMIFDIDLTDIEITEKKYEPNVSYLEINKWDDNTWVLSKGYEINFSFFTGSMTVWNKMWRLTQLEFFDSSGESLGTQDFEPVIIGTYKYWPIAYSFKKLERKNYYIIVYNGTGVSNIQVDRCIVRVFNATTHAVVNTIYFNSQLLHWYNRAATSYYLDQDYYFTFFVSNSDLFGTVKAMRFYEVNGTWYTSQTTIAYTAANTAYQLEGLGQYIAIYNKTYVFNVLTNAMQLNWWPFAPNGLGKALHRGVSDDPYQFVTGFNIEQNYTMFKYLRADNTVGYTNILDAMPEDYTMRIAPTYWRTYRGLCSGVGIVQDADGMTNVIMVGNQFFPFIKRPPLSENENLHDTIQDLATAGACLYHFPDNTRVSFISRAYYDSTVHTITPELFGKRWHITTQVPRRVIVQSGDMEVEVGDESKALTISSDYIPDHSDAVGKAYAQAYYNFLVDTPILIELDTDFLIQYEPFDTVKIIDRNNNQFLGKLMKTVKEGMDVEFEIRGRELA